MLFFLFGGEGLEEQLIEDENVDGFVYAKLP
jgi:hypothetical protein